MQELVLFLATIHQKARVLKHSPMDSAALYNQQQIVYNFNRQD